MNRRAFSTAEVEYLSTAIAKAMPSKIFSDEEMERLARVFSVVLQQNRSVSDSEHYDHHAWIKKRIEAEQWRAKLFRVLFEHVAKVGTIGLVTAAGLAAYMIGRRFLEWAIRGLL